MTTRANLLAAGDRRPRPPLPLTAAGAEQPALPDMTLEQVP
jgi:hypothetical protein